MIEGRVPVDLKVAEESFPGELGNALAMLESMKCGRKVWRQGNRRPVRVLIHCYGGINRTCAAYCALVMAFASFSWKKPLPCGSSSEPTMLHSKIVSI